MKFKLLIDVLRKHLLCISLAVMTNYGSLAFGACDGFLESESLLGKGELLIKAPEMTMQLAAARGLADKDDISHIKNAVLSIKRFLLVVHERSSILEEEVEKRLGLVNAFLSEFPAKLVDYKIKGEYSLYNQQEDSPTKRYAQLFTLETLAVKLQNDLKLQDLVRSLRVNSNILNSSEVQTLMQELLLAGVAFSIQHDTRSTQNPLGWGVQPVFLYSFITHVLPGHFGPTTNYKNAESDNDVYINSSYSLLVQMMSEIITNATEVTQRRHPEALLPGQINWNLIYPSSRVTREADGGVRIEIEDFGFPEEFMELKGVGDSNKQKNGVGFGRFRTYLLAKFMGYRIAYQAKADGSGSIVSISIPKDHLVDKKTALEIYDKHKGYK